MVAFLPRSVDANMASPIRHGSATGLPLVSTYISVVHELLKITPAADFKTCLFAAEYDIVADTDGISLPMLFVAENYQDGMQVWVDGRPVDVQPLPSEYRIQELSPLSRFGEPRAAGGGHLEVTVQWEPEFTRTYDASDLHFFLADLSRGRHTIRVLYTAKVWRDVSNVVAKEKFPYALEPASHWHSFGALDIELDLKQAPYPAETNLGVAGKKDESGVLHWHFDRLPAIPTLELVAVPVLSSWANFMMGIGQNGFFWIGLVLAGVAVILGLWRHRKRHTSNWFSWIWLAGSLVGALVPMYFFVASAGWIDDAIGPAASRRSDYSFLIVIFYPVVLLGLGAVTRLADHFFLRAARRSQSLQK